MTYPPGPPSGNQYGGQAPTQPRCFFHPDRPTALSCTRCGRPACAEDLTPASVGFQCKVCVQEGRATQRVARTMAGARVGQQPIVTYVLIAINVIIFAICAGQAGSGLDVSNSAVSRWGAMMPILVGEGEYWRLLSSGFLHLGLVHLAMNMLSLGLLGVVLERVLGPVRFLVVYFLALIGGSAAIMWFSEPLSFTVGASGAIFGLMGGLVVAYRRVRADMRQLVAVLAINLYLSFQFADAISWQGHLGGLFAGAAVTALMVYPAAEVRKKWQIGGSIAVLLVLVAAISVRSTQVDDWGCALRSDDLVWCYELPPGA